MKNFLRGLISRFTNCDSVYCSILVDNGHSKAALLRPYSTEGELEFIFISPSDYKV